MLIMHSSYCQLLYIRQPSICNIKFWTDASSTHGRKTAWVKLLTFSTLEQDNDLDELTTNWVSTHFNKHQDFHVRRPDSWERRNGFEFSSNEMNAPFYTFDAIGDIDTEPYSNDESAPLRGVVNCDEVQTFKRVHFTKSKDAHHCVERVMNLFVSISSLIVERNRRDSGFLSEASPVSTQFKQTLQRLLSLRDQVLEDSQYPDYSNSMTILMSSLSTIHRLKPVLASLRNSTGFKFDLFFIMERFFTEVNSMRETHKYIQPSKIPSPVGRSILTMNRPVLRIFTISRASKDFRDYTRPSRRRHLSINQLTE